MNRRPDAIHLVKHTNPIPDPELMPDGPRCAFAQALLEDIMELNPSEATTGRSRRTTLVLAAAMLVLAAGAAWAYGISGVFPEPAFSGETWKLTVGEEANGDTGTYKVCHSFERVVGADMGNGLGPAGCGDWPTDDAGPVIIDVVPAVQTPEGVVLLVDLTTEPVANVSVTPDRGPTVEVKPYVMPQSRKQFAVVELRSAARRATVRLFDNAGGLIERKTVADLTIAR